MPKIEKIRKTISSEQMAHEDLIEELERTRWRRYWAQIKKHWPIYVMLIPVLLFFYFFRYRPIGGILVAFKNYDNYAISIGDSDFYGLYAFKYLIVGPQATQFWQAFRNTFTLSAYGLFFGFPIPIILALFFSEIKNEAYRSITQVISYLPRFISTVVITSLIALMLYQGNIVQSPGILNSMFTKFGWAAPRTPVLSRPEYFRSIYIISNIWEGAGYGSIVYFAAIMAINPTNYEAARIDGASKLAQIRYITFPGMAPTLTIMLILRIGDILNIGYEKVLLLTEGRAEVLSTAQVLSTYVLSLGGLWTSTGSTGINFAAAADVFNSFIAMFLVLGANFISRRVSDTSLF
ncbi:MAG: ABC transporter permease subunit [Candidatus Izemoplasmatales bacterium]|nr:ABC transporter permease subunit [Candidatus Izemoplasmatales bacterium]